MSIEFTKEELYFKVASYKLSSKQKTYLDKFSNKLIGFLQKHKTYVDALEINGHTSSEWGGASLTHRYLKNEKLSMNRSYSVLSHIFKNQDLKAQTWLTNILKGSGYSYSKNVMQGENEDKDKSRRVSFKIILK